MEYFQNFIDPLLNRLIYRQQGQEMVSSTVSRKLKVTLELESAINSSYGFKRKLFFYKGDYNFENIRGPKVYEPTNLHFVCPRTRFFSKNILQRTLFHPEMFPQSLRK